MDQDAGLCGPGWPLLTRMVVPSPTVCKSVQFILNCSCPAISLLPFSSKLIVCSFAASLRPVEGTYVTLSTIRECSNLGRGEPRDTQGILQIAHCPYQEPTTNFLWSVLFHYTAYWILLAVFSFILLGPASVVMAITVRWLQLGCLEEGRKADGQKKQQFKEA